MKKIGSRHPPKNGHVFVYVASSPEDQESTCWPCSACLRRSKIYIIAAIAMGLICLLGVLSSGHLLKASMSARRGGLDSKANIHSTAAAFLPQASAALLSGITPSIPRCDISLYTTITHLLRMQFLLR